MRYHSGAQRFTAGIASGALGGAALLSFLSAASVFDQDPWWRFPNLLGTTFYGAFALRAGPGLPTLAGAALEVLLCGVIGGLFGWVFAGAVPGARLMLLGMATGLVWNYAAERLYERLSPLVPLYSASFPLTFGYLVFGAFLGTAGWFLSKPPKPAPPPAPPLPSATPESGAAPPPPEDAGRE